MPFQWDEQKNATNIRKHGIDFNDAVKVFSDPHFLVREDMGNRYDETRMQIIGRASHVGVLFVVYTERHEDMVRIISARPATKREKHVYEQSL